MVRKATHGDGRKLNLRNPNLTGDIVRQELMIDAIRFVLSRRLDESRRKVNEGLLADARIELKELRKQKGIK